MLVARGRLCKRKLISIDQPQVDKHLLHVLFGGHDKLVINHVVRGVAESI